MVEVAATDAAPGWVEAFRSRTNGKVNALIMGGSGAVGKSLVSMALKSNAFEKITLLARRPLVGSPFESADGRLEVKVVDFEKLNGEDVQDAQVFFCCHGTTRKQAGSASEFVRIDKGFVLNVAKVWKDANQNRADQLQLVLCSATGANASSWFLYPRTKGELENELAALNLYRFSVLHPGFLLGRAQGRFGEEIFTKYLLPAADLLVSRKKTSVYVEEVAMAMLKIGISRPGENAIKKTGPNGESMLVYSNQEIADIAAETTPAILQSW